MSLSATVKAMADAGCSTAQIAAVVAAHEAETERKLVEKRAKDAERQRRRRASERPNGHTESRGQDVTDRDSTDPAAPSFSPFNPPPIPPPYNPPNPTPPPNTHSAREPSDGQRYADAVRNVYAIAGQACPDLSPLVAWRKAGWPIEIICEVIRAKLAANPSKNFPLRYFENAIADAVARANAPVPIGQANQRAGPNGSGERPMTAAAAILQKDREKSRNERHYAESQHIVLDALPAPRGAG